MGREVAAAQSLSGAQALRDLRDIVEAEAAIRRHDGWPITALIAVAEAYVTKALIALIEQRRNHQSDFELALVEEQRIDIFHSWDSRLSWLKKGFNLPLLSQPSAQHMKTANELRNAIVHGNSRLTDLQCQDIPKMISLKRELLTILAVHCVGRQVVLSDASLTLVWSKATSFVAAADGMITEAYPGLPI